MSDWPYDNPDTAYAFNGFCPETEEAITANLRRYFGRRYRWVSRTRGTDGHWWWGGLLRRPSFRVCRNRRFPVRGTLVYVRWSVTVLWVEVWGYSLDLAATWDGKAKEMVKV